MLFVDPKHCCNENACSCICFFYIVTRLIYTFKIRSLFQRLIINGNYSTDYSKLTDEKIPMSLSKKNTIHHIIIKINKN